MSKTGQITVRLNKVRMSIWLWSSAASGDAEGREFMFFKIKDILGRSRNILLLTILISIFFGSIKLAGNNLWECWLRTNGPFSNTDGRNTF